MTDFLITFTVDGTQAISMMNAIGAEATALEARLNALGKSSSGAGTAGNILSNIGLSQGAMQQATAGLGRLESQVSNFKASIAAATTLKTDLGAGQYKTAAIAAQSLANALGPTDVRYKQLTQDAQTWIDKSRQVANSTDESTQAFGRHTQRIFEAILIYEAFAVAMQGLKGGLDLIVDIDRESRRLEAALTIGPQAAAGFIENLGQIASDTVTPFEHLVAEADRASAAVSDIADPTERAAAAEELLRRAGQFTTVTQRDLGTEIQNVISIMKQAGVEVDDLGDFLGKIVVAGGNASTRISTLTDALRVSAQAASQSKVDFDVLLAAEDAFFVQTGRGGSEIGNIFKLLFQRISDPDVVNKVDDITGGMLRLRTAAGAIRDPFKVLLELKALLDKGVISATQFSDVLDTIAPPLNPAARADFRLIVDSLDDIGPAIARIDQAGAGSLNDLVDKINDALGPQFQKLLIDVQRGFTKMFSGDVLAAGQGIINILRTLGDVLGALPPELVKLVAETLALFAAWRTLVFVGGALTAMLGGFGAAATGAAAAEGAAATATFTLGGAMRATMAVAARFLPVLLALAAVDIASHFLEEADKLKVFRDQLGLSEDEANAALRGITVTPKTITPGKGGSFTQQPNITPGLRDLGIGAPAAAGVGDQVALNAQRQNLNNLALAIKSLNDAGQLTPEVQQSMTDAMTKTNEAGKGVIITTEQLITAGSGLTDSTAGTSAAWEDAVKSADRYSTRLQTMSAEQKIAAEASDLLAGLATAQGEALQDLNERMAEGDITQQQYAEGQGQVAQAADLASQLVAAYGDKLRNQIPELAAAADGNDALAEELFKVILGAGDSLPVIAANVDELLKLAAASEGAAAAQRAMAQEMATAAAIEAGTTGNLNGLIGLVNSFSGAAIGAAAATSVWAQELARLALVRAATTGDLNAIIRLPGLLSSIANGTTFSAPKLPDVGSFFAALRNQFANSGSTPFGTNLPSGGSGGSGGTGTRQQTPILDIGDLPKSQIIRLIQIATQLRNRVPGGRAESRGDTVSLTRDAKFLRNVKGIDDRFLREALDRLTKQMERANDREDAKARSDALLRNLTINHGPLGALISQPTAFGVAGSLAAGNGLNFNPDKGNFVINVPIELKGLQPAALQQLIYNIISKAIRDGLRL